MPTILDELFALSDLTQRFRLVERRNTLAGSDRHENDAEHCFHLSFLVSFLIERLSLHHLDHLKCKRLAEMHDLVEIYAGDTFFFDTSDHALGKQERENNAFEQLREEFLFYPSLPLLIGEYEEQASPEARFVHAVDKISPMLYVALDRGRSWIREGVHFEQLKHNKVEKVRHSAEVMPILEELLAYLETHPEFFSQPK